MPCLRRWPRCGLHAPDAPDRDAMLAMAEAAEAGAAATIPLVARKGRASYLGERSAGHLDPGAASSAILIRCLADAVTGDRTGSRCQPGRAVRSRATEPGPSRRAMRPGSGKDAERIHFVLRFRAGPRPYSPTIRACSGGSPRDPSAAARQSAGLRKEEPPEEVEPERPVRAARCSSPQGRRLG